MSQTSCTVRGLSCSEAGRFAYEAALIDWLNAIHPDTLSDRCAHCGKRETRGATLLPFGVGIRHTWLHSDCWTPRIEQRRAKAEENLAPLGIAKHHKPSKGAFDVKH
jgi:hypothetical protein